MSVSTQSRSRPKRGASALAPVAWASFLAMSWTWCIGMFLPVILVRQFGVAGWLVFALPNVIGAAAMGWILRSRQASRDLIRTHALAGAAFSWVTIAFHFFFVSWVLGRLVGLAGEMTFLGAMVVFYVAGRGPPRRDLFSSLLPLVLSLGAMGVFLLRAPVNVPPIDAPNLSTMNLLSLACVCAFGFAFCPYLDLTFHRARRSTGGSAARFAFGFGFGVIFLVMILFTLFYAPPVASWVLDAKSAVPRDALVVWAVAGHMAVQSGFTVVLHQRELRRHGTPLVSRLTLALLAVGIGFILLDLPAALHAENLVSPIASFAFAYHGPFNTMSGGELVYRLFMAFYGLFFPAYVWLRIVPAGGVLRRRHPVAWKTYFLLTAAVLPLFYLGFIEAKFYCLIPGVLILFLGRSFAGKRSPTTNVQTRS